MKVEDLRTSVVNVSNKSNWVLVRLETSSPKLIGVGEATLSGYEDHVVACVRRLAARLVGAEVPSIEALTEGLGYSPEGLANAAAVSVGRHTR